MKVAEWLASAKADAQKRGLPDLVPLLEGVARATELLRAADWNERADRDPQNTGEHDAADSN